MPIEDVEELARNSTSSDTLFRQISKGADAYRSGDGAVLVDTDDPDGDRDIIGESDEPAIHGVFCRFHDWHL